MFAFVTYINTNNNEVGFEISDVDDSNEQEIIDMAMAKPDYKPSGVAIYWNDEANINERFNIL